MPRVVVALGLVFALILPAAAQQTGLTEGQIKTAELEIPELVALLCLKPGMTIVDVGAGFGAVREGRRSLGGRVYSRT